MIRENCEYRSFQLENRSKEDKEQYKVRGYASTYDKYVLWEDGDNTIYERIDPKAFNDTDFSDIVLLYNHEGMVYARNRNNTLNVTTDDHGLKVEADLSSTTQSREAFEAIDSGLIDQMSFAFTVSEDAYDKESHTRTILRIGKIYDVSFVSVPANPNTDISSVSARDYFHGVMEAEEAERLLIEQRNRDIARLNLKIKLMEASNGN